MPRVLHATSGEADDAWRLEQLLKAMRHKAVRAGQVLTMQGAPLHKLFWGRRCGGLCLGNERIYVALPRTQFHKEDAKPPEVGVLRLSRLGGEP